LQAHYALPLLSNRDEYSSVVWFESYGVYLGRPWCGVLWWVCLWIWPMIYVRLYLRNHTFRLLCMLPLAVAHWLIPFSWRCNTLCTFGCVDDVMCSYNGPVAG